MSKELKQCPCCGGKAVRREYMDEWKVSCLNCGLGVSGWGEEIDKWNRREESHIWLPKTDKYIPGEVIHLGNRPQVYIIT